MKNLFAYMQQVYDRRSFALILSSVFLLNVVSCSRKTDSSSDYNSMLSDTVFTLKIDRPYYIDKYSNLFSEVRYVALEETQNSIVGEITKMEITNEGDYIIFDFRSKGVYRFSSDGRFLNTIGVRGPGEKEYVLPWDMKYDPFHNRVLVWDNGKRSILTYEMDGTLYSKVQLPWVIASFGIVDEECIICYMNNDEDILGDEKGTNYKIVKRDGTIVKEFGEYGIEMADFNPSAEKTFSSQNGKCLCMPPYSNTLFRVEGDSLNAIASFDFGENNIPRNWLCGSNRDVIEKMEQHPNLVELSTVFDTGRYYLLKLSRNHFQTLCLIQKDTKEIKSVAVNMINDLFGMVGNTSLRYVYGDKLFFAIEPQEFERMNSFLHSVPEDGDIKKAIMKGKDTIYESTASMFGADAAVAHVDSLKSANFKLSPGERELISEMSQKSNPIIQVCTLK